MKVLQLVSCRGWSSDAYWAARASRELARRGHAVVLGCRRGTEQGVIARARAEGVDRIETFAFASGLRPRADLADLHRLAAAVRAADVVHVHRGKEHWLAVAACGFAGVRRPIVRTRHIAQAVRPHAGNRWLYGHATDLVVAVTDAIRRQLVVSGLVASDRAITVAGGADVDRYRPRAADPAVRAALARHPDAPLVGMISGLRVMKGHLLVLDALDRLGGQGLAPDVAFVGRGSMEDRIRVAVREAGLADRVTLAGWVADLPAAMAALDVGLYVPLESDGMSRVVFEYLAAGCPLVASRVGVVAEILAADEHAVLVPAGDAGALAAGLARVLRDAPLRARLREGGRRVVVERYSGARLAAALETEYARLLAA